MPQSDVRYVVAKTLLPTVCSDRYHGEYYGLQLVWKRFQEKKMKASQEAAATGVPVSVSKPPALPLPTWPDTKQRLKEVSESRRLSLKEKTKLWEETEHVLGHVTRSDISRPRELLAVAGLADLELELDGNGLAKLPFTSKSWNVRGAIQHGYSAFYTIQELELLLRQAYNARDKESRGEIAVALKAALADLATSVGLHTVAGADGSETVNLEGGLLSAIVAVNKGKRLLTRCLKVLSDKQRYLSYSFLLIVPETN